MITEQKKHTEEQPQLSKWQRELKEKFNIKNLEDKPKKETLSQDAAKKLLGDGLAQ